MSTETAYAKCACRHCDNYLEFDTSHAGESIACPHCGMDTILFVPPPPNSTQPARKNLWLLLIGVMGSLALLVVVIFSFRRAAPFQIQNQPKTQKQPVTGAFGLVLGQRLVDAFRLQTNEDGEITVESTILETNSIGEISVKDVIESEPPFGSVIAWVNPQRTVYQLFSIIRGEDDDAVTTLKAMLAEKYGQFGEARRTSTMCRTEFGDEKRKIEVVEFLHSASITYRDTGLARAEKARTKAIKDNMARTRFKDL
jgi:hypothetical protein